MRPSLPVLELEESPHFVSLYNPTRRGRLDDAVKLPLYPFAFAWLLVLERWRGWHGWGLVVRGLTARPNTLEATVQVGRLIPRHYLSVRNDTIERLTIDLGREGDREVALTVRVRYRNRRGRPLTGEASFVVADVDTHREAMALIFRFARKLGCAGYRSLPRDEEGFVVELLFPADDLGARGYRDPGRPSDVHPIRDDDEITDFRPREHGGFVEPEGANIPAPRPERVGIETFEPGELVVAGKRGKPWLVLLFPLLVIGGLLIWLLGAIVGGAIFGLVGAVVSIAADLIGLDLWSVLFSDFTTKLTFVASAIVALFYAAPPAVAVYQESFGARVTIDWRTGYLERGGLFFRVRMPLSQIRGVDVRSTVGTRSLLVRTAEGDVQLATGGDELTPIAVVLARSLNVPVTHPEDG